MVDFTSRPSVRSVGASAYRGGYYDRSGKYELLNQNGNQVVEAQYTTIAKFDEFSFGADLEWQWKQRLVQGEFIMNDVTYDKNARPRLQVLKPPQGFQSDYRRWGACGLLGYRTRFNQTMPYFVLRCVFAPDNPVAPPALVVQVGLNTHATPAVVLKSRIQRDSFQCPGSIGLGNSPLRILGTQVALAF